jgi:archaemetzincin
MRLVERAAAPVAVVPLGDVAPAELQRIERILDEDFAASAVVLPRVPLPEESYCRERQQYDADVLLETLFLHQPERCLRVIGVADADLFVRGRTFVFGYAHLTDGMAIYSVTRLRESFYGRDEDLSQLAERVRRAAVHELGHTFGSPHCGDGGCVMHPVSHVDTLDALSTAYCASCRERVARGLDTPPWSARGRWDRGLAFLRRRDFMRAAEWLTHAAQCAPLDASIHHDLGVALLGLGERSRARAALRRALQLTPADAVETGLMVTG